jgi:hypothetical protein
MAASSGLSRFETCCGILKTGGLISLLLEQVPVVSSCSSTLS